MAKKTLLSWSSGKDSALATIKNLAGFSAKAEHPTGDKTIRAEPFQAQCMIENVKLVRGAWIPAYLNELCSFPTGSHDDQVDASSGAFNKIALGFGGNMSDLPQDESRPNVWDIGSTTRSERRINWRI